MKIKRYHRKKGFRLKDLLEYLRRNENEEVDEQQQQADELLAIVKPELQSKIQDLLINRVEILLGIVERQNMKLVKIAD